VWTLQSLFHSRLFNAALLKDPKSVLEKLGPNTRHPDTIRFTNNAQVHSIRPTIHFYLDEAKGYAEAGIKPPKENNTLELPDELVDALEADSMLPEAFCALAPGRQKSYVINLDSAKENESRRSRIAKFRDKIAC